jgi:hypothetical protein
MNRIEEINNELKIIKYCEEARRFYEGIRDNGGEVENSYSSYLKNWHKCVILDSSISDMTTLKAYKKKLISERSFLKNNETKARFEKWLDKPNHNKFVKYLKNKYGNNLTLGFNKHVEEL